MAQGVRYFCVRIGETIAAVSSAEVHAGEGNVEMTDFATLPEYRGRGLSGYLLGRMEAAMRTAGIRTAYTIARAASLPMNLVFARAGYAYGGTLVNNTGICGGLESMHVWHKPLPGR
jgi:beta-lysine N6-acetyltransferase